MQSISIVLLAACGPRTQAGPTSAELRAPERAARGAEVAILRPARYVATDRAAWVERTGDGLDRVVINGARVEARGLAIERFSASAPEVEAGALVPAWALSGAGGPRYLFWNNKDLYGAETFLGDLSKIATTAADISRAFDWLDGVGLLTSGGALLVRGGAVQPFPRPGVVAAVAEGPKAGALLTTFGRAWLTTSGPQGLHDVTDEIGDATRVEVRGGAIAILARGERARFVSASGAIVDNNAKPGRPRGARPKVIDENWPEPSNVDPIEAAAQSGVPLADGSILVAISGHVARVDAQTGKAIASSAIPEPDATCAPIQVSDGLLLVCQGRERASVIDVTGAPRVERTFDTVDAADYDRFVGVDGEAVGFVGPCAGGGPRPSDLDVLTAASPYSSSNQRSAVFCARASRDRWVEHRVDPADRADVFAWIPRARGAAVAIVARPGMHIDDAERVSERGDLRIVRVARSEPPLAVPLYSGRASVALSRAARALPDGSIDIWLPATGYGNNAVGATIDALGQVRVRSSPSRATSLSTFGPFAMAQTDDGKLFETVDWGRSWISADPPLGAPLAPLSNCSAAGCRVGPFFRLGWASSADPAARSRAPSVLSLDDDILSSGAQRTARERGFRRAQPAPPIVRLRCAFASPAAGARIADSYGFGVTPSPVARGTAASKIGWMGTMSLPWSGPQITLSGDAEVAWAPLFDPAAPVRRAALPVSNLGLDLRYRPYDIRLGYVIDADGRVSPIATGPKESCVAPILEKAGLVRPIGGCAAESTMGVDLGSKIVLHSGRYASQTVSVVELPRAGGRALSGEPAGSRGAIVVAQRELNTTPVAPGVYGYVFAVGARAGAPVVIAIDAFGSAVLSPIDPDRGTLGPEEALASLTSVALGGDPKCAPAPDDARVVVPFDSQIGIDRARIPAVSAAGTYGLAVVRWSTRRACLDAIEISVRDERYEQDVGFYEPPGTMRKLIARFLPSPAGRPGGGPPEGPGNGALALILHGAEVRQRVQCDGIGP